MASNIELILKSCEACQTSKAVQRHAHKMWKRTPLSAPRATWGFDLKGVHPSSNGSCEIGVAIDLCTHSVVLFAAPDRKAGTLTQLILDRVVNVYGVPLRWRTEAAQELVGKVMSTFWQCDL